jgi:hypothetical protein
MASGWFRNKDEKTICPEGYLIKQRTPRESREDMEVKKGIARPDPLLAWHP